MKKIIRYQINPGENILTLPVSHKIISAYYNYDGLCVFVLQSEPAGDESINVPVFAFLTAETIDNKTHARLGDFIETVKVESVFFHVFEGYGVPIK